MLDSGLDKDVEGTGLIHGVIVSVKPQIRLYCAKRQNCHSHVCRHVVSRVRRECRECRVVNVENSHWRVRDVVTSYTHHSCDKIQ